mgnify:FL=1|jgi:hypothetical protein
MFSIKGIFKNDTIHLIEPLNLRKKSNVIITFLEDDEEELEEESFVEFEEPEMDIDDDDDDSSFEEMIASEPDDSDSSPYDDELSEDYYSKIRKHKRYLAKGNISLIEGDLENTYPLYDYSAGGLSFISDKVFDVGKSLTASIKDPIEQDTSVLDFEFEVARVENYEGQFKIGCKFFDEVDEEIWHSLMS